MLQKSGYNTAHPLALYTCLYTCLYAYVRLWIRHQCTSNMNLPIMALHIGSTVGSLNYSAYTSCVCGCAREFGLCVWCQLTCTSKVFWNKLHFYQTMRIWKELNCGNNWVWLYMCQKSNLWLDQLLLPVQLVEIVQMVHLRQLMQAGSLQLLAK